MTVVSKLSMDMVLSKSNWFLQCLPVNGGLTTGRRECKFPAWKLVSKCLSWNMCTRSIFEVAIEWNGWLRMMMFCHNNNCAIFTGRRQLQASTLGTSTDRTSVHVLLPQLLDDTLANPMYGCHLMLALSCHQMTNCPVGFFLWHVSSMHFRSL